jgi:hypothetical protein
MITRSQACLLAAQAEIDAVRGLNGKAGQIEKRAAEMRADAIRRAATGKRLPPALEYKVLSRIYATEAIGA